MRLPRLLKIFVLTGFVTLQSLTASSQNVQSNDPDKLFTEARELAFSKNYQAAIHQLKKLLRSYPAYYDAKIFLGRTYGWAEKYDSAQIELQSAISEKETEEAFVALTDVLIWDKNFIRAEEVVVEAFTKFPNSEPLLYRYAIASTELGNYDIAIKAVTQVLQMNPANEEAAALLSSLQRKNLRWVAGANYNLDAFERIFDPAHYFSAFAGRTSKWGQAYGRLNYANRFSTTGVQPEIDLYPKIKKDIYAYVNYGYSNSQLFANHRIGAEFFAKIPYNFELSGGLRYLNFRKNSEALIFTGSAGWYFRSYLISYRVYVTPDKDHATAVSHSAFLRRYFNNPDNWLGLSWNMGYSADERRFQSAGGLTTDVITLLEATRGGIQWQHALEGNYLLSLSAEVGKQELAFESDHFVNFISGSIGLRKRF